MSIPEQLKQAYKQQAESMNPQIEPDSKLLAQFAHQAAKQGRRRTSTIVQSRRHTWTRPLFMKIAIGLTILALVSGFADYIWVRISDDRVNIQYGGGINRALDASMLSVLRSELQQVRGQLAPGEAALVYSLSMGKLIPEMASMPFIAVSNPIMVKELDAWKIILKQEVGDYSRLPSEQSMDNPLTFIGGKREGISGPDMTSTDMKLLQELKADAEKAPTGSSANRFAWRIRPAQEEAGPLLRSYTTMYSDARHHQIDIGLQLATEQVQMRLIASGAEQSVEVNGSKGVYLRTEPFIFSETNQYQTIQWLETHDNVTIIYSVGSPSAEVTKEQLLAIAASMSE